MEKHQLEFYLNQIKEQDFTGVEERFSNIDWRDYRKYNPYEKFQFHCWLLQKEMKGELSFAEVIKNLATTDIFYTVSLIRGDEILYFEKYHKAGDFLGVSQSKIALNKHKLVNGWLVKPCEVREIVNEHTGEVLSRF
ncbi:hypothetical protein [Priestia megaterium]|uniref:hypothetical protein n=1 Tax=Priestia megaterium TaxID=1404 RepID=UPI00301C228F